MQKRGQITIFIIIGILILVAVGISIFYMQDLKTVEGEIIQSKHLTLQSSSQSIKNYVYSCLEFVAEEGIILLGIQGGHISLPENIFSTATWNTSYLYFEEENNLPTLEEMEQDLAIYIENNIIQCINFTIFNSVTVESENITVEVTVRDGTVSFDLNWPLIISMEGLQKNLKDFNIMINLDFHDIYVAVNSLVEATENHPNMVDNILLSSQNVTFIDYIIEDNDKVIYLITEENDGLNQPYYFLFAIKKIHDEKNEPPLIEEVPILEANVGELFFYQIEATDPEGEPLIYSLRSVLFEINENTGAINFTPTLFERGNHFFSLTVQDIEGNVATSFINLNVAFENTEPDIMVTNQTIIINEEFNYYLSVFDEESYDLIIEIIEGPEDMVIENNQLFWTPEELGIYTVTLSVNDGELSNEGSFMVEVISS